MTDKRKDITLLIVAYRDFANAPKRKQSFSDLKKYKSALVTITVDIHAGN
jgi:hypothetical protein